MRLKIISPVTNLWFVRTLIAVIGDSMLIVTLVMLMIVFTIFCGKGWRLNMTSDYWQRRFDREAEEKENQLKDEGDKA